MTKEQVKDISRLNELTPLHINPYNLGDMGEISKIIGRLFKSTPSSTTPSLNAGSLEEAADNWIGDKGGENLSVLEISHLKAAFIGGAAYVKGGEEKPINLSNLEIRGVSTGARPSRFGKYVCIVQTRPIAYSTHLKVLEYGIGFDGKEGFLQENEDFLPLFWVENLPLQIYSRPSLDIDKVVEQLREQNPYCGEIDFSEDARIAWEKSCDKLKELLNQSK